MPRVRIYLRPGKATRFANHVCYHTDRVTEGDETATMVRRDIHHYAVTVPRLRNLGATAIQITLAS